MSMGNCPSVKKTDKMQATRENACTRNSKNVRKLEKAGQNDPNLSKTSNENVFEDGNSLFVEAVSSTHSTSDPSFSLGGKKGPPPKGSKVTRSNSQPPPPKAAKKHEPPKEEKVVKGTPEGFGEQKTPSGKAMGSQIPGSLPKGKGVNAQKGIFGGYDGNWRGSYDWNGKNQWKYTENEWNGKKGGKTGQNSWNVDQGKNGGRGRPQPPSQNYGKGWRY